MTSSFDLVLKCCGFFLVFVSFFPFLFFYLFLFVCLFFCDIVAFAESFCGIVVFSPPQ